MNVTAKAAMLEARHVSKTYRGRGHPPVYALRDVSVTLRQGRCLGVVGESGCGKSTLCRILAGVERPGEGQILWRGRPADYRRNRRNLQMVFQNSLDAVNLHVNVGRTLSEPLENFFRLDRAGREREVERLLELVGLSPEDKRKYPKQFSGGQLQRVCIARALAAQPEVLLLDEPLSSLDVSVQAQLLNLLADLKAEYQLTCLLVSHDLEAVYYLADSLLVMYGGTVVEELEDIGDLSALRHPYTRRLLAAGTLDSGEAEASASRPAAWAAGEAGQEGCVYAPRCPMAKEECFRSRPVLRELSAGHKAACFQLSAGADARL